MDEEIYIHPIQIYIIIFEHGFDPPPRLNNVKKKIHNWLTTVSLIIKEHLHQLVIHEENIVIGQPLVPSLYYHP